MLYYAGIGSRRRTPTFIHTMMTQIASKLEKQGYILRSGGAQGADKAFEAGVVLPEHKQIFRAKDATYEAMTMAAQYHGYWERCTPIARKLHGRNSMIIMGRNLKVPVQFVICYTPDGKSSGGTGLGINMSTASEIPVFNLYFKEVQERFNKFLDKPKDVDLF